jgi:uncharacterized membrane protein (DUF106 family)
MPQKGVFFFLRSKPMITPEMGLVITSAIFAVISQILQLVLVNRKDTRALQKKMKEKSQKQRELILKGNANPAEMEQLQKEQMELLNQTMKSTPKMMMASLIDFYPCLG